MSRIMSGLRSRPILVVAGVVLAAIVVIALTNRNTAVAQEQPIDYSHKVHIDAGMECLFCHSGATRSPIAAVPSVQKCMGCHEVMATENESVQTLIGYWEREESIPWQRVNKQPDFVYFSHQPHVNSGLACESCHGEVGSMDIAEKTGEMDMGWCLDCHAEQHEDIAPHLWDCLVCHQ